jgi:hypothetical protein
VGGAMTRDEILNMPAGKKMDELTAFHVMDWGKRLTLSGLEIYVNKETGRDMIGAELWQPSKFIVYAWTAAEKMGAEITLAYRGKYWFCDFGNQDNWDYSQSDAAPLAICRAALLAVMPL